MDERSRARLCNDEPERENYYDDENCKNDLEHGYIILLFIQLSEFLFVFFDFFLPRKVFDDCPFKLPKIVDIFPTVTGFQHFGVPFAPAPFVDIARIALSEDVAVVIAKGKPPNGCRHEVACMDSAALANTRACDASKLVSLADIQREHFPEFFAKDAFFWFLFAMFHLIILPHMLTVGKKDLVGLKVFLVRLFA